MERSRPDVVVMDIRMRRVDGAAATGTVRTMGRPPVLVLTTFDDDQTLAAALRAGAAGFALESAPGEDILRAIATVAAGESWIDPHIAGRVLAAYRDHAPPEPADLSMRTDRELDVLRCVGRGLDNREVAALLHLGTSRLSWWACSWCALGWSSA